MSRGQARLHHAVVCQLHARERRRWQLRLPRHQLWQSLPRRNHVHCQRPVDEADEGLHRDRNGHRGMPGIGCEGAAVHRWGMGRDKLRLRPLDGAEWATVCRLHVVCLWPIRSNMERASAIRPQRGRRLRLRHRGAVCGPNAMDCHDQPAAPALRLVLWQLSHHRCAAVSAQPRLFSDGADDWRSTIRHPLDPVL
jgi:hypothetical protein